MSLGEQVECFQWEKWGRKREECSRQGGARWAIVGRQEQVRGSGCLMRGSTECMERCEGAPAVMGRGGGSGQERAGGQPEVEERVNHSFNHDFSKQMLTVCEPHTRAILVAWDAKTRCGPSFRKLGQQQCPHQHKGT